MKKFNISNDCNACGICINMTDLILEDEKGKAYPLKEGFISEEYFEEAKKIETECPAKAISIVETGNTKLSGKEGLREIENILKNKLHSIEKPKINRDDIQFYSSDYNIEYAKPTGDYEGKYSSLGQAERAGLSEFNRVAYSQYRVFILSVFVQYKNDKLKKYYSFDKNGYYAKNNIKYEDILKEIIAEAKAISDNKISLSEEFAIFDVFPGGEDIIRRDNLVKRISKFEEESTRSGIMANFRENPRSSLDSYKIYIDTDCRETGEDDWLDRPVVVCYYESLNEVIEQYISDLRDSMDEVNIEETVEEFLEEVIESYSEEISSNIDRKIKEFSNAIEKL